MPTPDISPAPRAPDPLTVIRAACKAAARLGHIVSTGPDLGVVCDSTLAPGWVRDERVATVSPLGAVLLVMQPPIPVADEALAAALGVSPVWILAFDDAVSGGAPGGSSILRGPAARLYGQGFVAGAEFRARHGVPVPRGADDITAPIAVERPDAASLVHQLLSSLTVADAVQALIGTIATRGWDRDTKEAVLEHLQETRDDFKAQGL